MPWVTQNQAAAIVGCRDETIRRAVASGELESHIPPGCRWVKINTDDLDAWVRTGESGACDAAKRRIRAMGGPESSATLREVG